MIWGTPMAQETSKWMSLLMIHNKIVTVQHWDKLRKHQTIGHYLLVQLK